MAWIFDLNTPACVFLHMHGLIVAYDSVYAPPVLLLDDCNANDLVEHVLCMLSRAWITNSIQEGNAHVYIIVAKPYTYTAQ